MLDRRRILQVGLAALGSFPLASPGAFAQQRPAVKVRYSEVVRSMMYAPAYVAITKGFFSEAGLDVTLTTAQGGDKSVAALLTNSADIALIGPETISQNESEQLRSELNEQTKNRAKITSFVNGLKRIANDTSLTESRKQQRLWKGSRIVHRRCRYCILETKTPGVGAIVLLRLWRLRAS